MAPSESSTAAAVPPAPPAGAATPGAANPSVASPGALDRLIDWSARNVFLVLLATLFLVAGGLYAVHKTPLDALPDL